MNQTKDRRILTRFLKTLYKHSKQDVLFTADGNEFVLTIEAGRHSFSKKVFLECVRTKCVVCQNNLVGITNVGIDRLKSLLNPDPAETDRKNSHSNAEIYVGKSDRMPDMNWSESPLSRLYNLKQKDGKRYIEASQFAAGEQLRSDFERGNLQPSMSLNWSNLESGSPGGAREGVTTDLTDFALDKRDCVFQALDRLAPELAGVAMDVCCFLKGLELVERERCWPPRSAKLMLRTALTILAKHYRIQSAPTSSPPRIQRWGASDYRPEIHAPADPD